MGKQNLEYLHNGVLLSNKKENLVHATIWMNLKNTVLSERSKAQKIMYYMVPFYLKIRKTIETKVDQWSPRAKSGNGNWLQTDIKKLFWTNKNLLLLDCGDGCILNLKISEFVLCTLYLNKVTFKRLYSPLHMSTIWTI